MRSPVIADSPVHGFAPIANQDTRVLVLGSIPGLKSLDHQQYYAHPQNAFWWIMQSAFNLAEGMSYEQRCAALLQNHVGLWDVLASCNRHGSLDSAIERQSEVVNDFERFFSTLPSLKAILFNGQKAQQSFFKHYDSKSLSQESLKWHTMPSTSPANARLTKQTKLEQWRLVLDKYR